MAIGYSSMFWISIPFFYPLQVTSVYEYLQMRHGSLLIRQVVMGLGAVNMVLYAGIVLFGAALALQSVTGIPVWVYIVSMSVFAIMYTSFGGIKAVVVADVIQGILMVAMIFAVVIYGTMFVGGVQSVIELNKPSGRLKLVDFDPSPLTRHTFWTLVVGSATRAISFSCRQPVIQRLNSTKSMNGARKVAAISIPGFVILHSLVMFEGLVVYAYFAKKGCDPLASGQISNPNQIISFAVMDMFENIPGMAALFLAAVCSAFLSTISSLLSSTSAIVSEDVIRPKWKTISDVNITKASKLIVVLFGVVCLGVGILISQVKGPIPPISGSILGAIDGPVTALFVMSIFIKFTTRRGLLVSIAIGIAFALWLSLGFNFSPGRKKTPWLPLGPTDKCYNEMVNETQFYDTTLPSNNISILEKSMTTVEPSEKMEIHGLDYLYSISYMYFSAMVTIVTLAIGIPLSKFTKLERRTPIPSYLMMSINKRFFRCQVNYEEALDQASMPLEVVELCEAEKFDKETG